MKTESFHHISDYIASQSAENSKMHPLSRLPGFVTILIVGLIIIGYGMTLPTLDPNWVIAIGVVFLIVALLAITVVR